MIGRKASGTLLTQNLLPGKNLYLLSTGTGLAPFMAMIRDPEVYELYEKVILVHGCRQVGELAYDKVITQELPKNEYFGEQVAAKLIYYPTVTREAFRNQGRIPTLMETGKLMHDIGLPPLSKENDRFMLCGSPEMLRDTRAPVRQAGHDRGQHEHARPLRHRTRLRREVKPDHAGRRRHRLGHDPGGAAHAAGTATCVLIALAATFVATLHSGPPMLYALLFGTAFHYQSSEERTAPGIDFCSRTLLRLGVGLLGARITLEQIAALGLATAGVVVLAVLSTLLCARLAGARAAPALDAGPAGRWRHRHLRRLGGARDRRGAAARAAGGRARGAGGGGAGHLAVDAGDAVLPADRACARPAAVAGGPLHRRQHPRRGAGGGGRLRARAPRWGTRPRW